MTDKAANLLSPAQRETLRRAMNDAVYYRDPPVQSLSACPMGYASHALRRSLVPRHTAN
jgi:hypothetical protein